MGIPGGESGASRECRDSGTPWPYGYPLTFTAGTLLVKLVPVSLRVETLVTTSCRSEWVWGCRYLPTSGSLVVNSSNDLAA